MSFTNFSFDNYNTDEIAKMLQEGSIFQTDPNDLNVKIEPNMVKEENYIPTAISNELAMSHQDYAGPYDFDIQIAPHHGKSPWIYSAPLNKLFILMSQKFPINFKLNGGENKDLYIRATPIYKNAENAQEVITRCIPHALESDKSNLGFSKEILHHVVRCHNKQAWYVGNNNTNEFLSVIVPLGIPQTGSSSLCHIYEFMCKNTCIAGMNRRPIVIIFTLEDGTGQILGRRVLSVKICSVPKRDKEKEEANYNRKENMSQCKKRKLSSSYQQKDEPICYNVNLRIPGKENVKLFYEMGFNIISGHMQRTGSQEQFQMCLKELQQKIDKLNE